MKRGRLARTLALGLFATCVSVLNTGCVGTAMQNLLVGFGFTLGSLPAQYVYDQLIGIVQPQQ